MLAFGCLDLGISSIVLHDIKLHYNNLTSRQMGEVDYKAI